MAEQPQEATIAEKLDDLFKRMERLEASMDVLVKAQERWHPVPPSRCRECKKSTAECDCDVCFGCGETDCDGRC